MLNLSIEDLRKLHELTKDSDPQDVILLTNRPGDPDDCTIGYSFGDAKFLSLEGS